MQSGEKPSWRSHAGFVAGDVDKSERYGDKSEMADEEVRERTARAPVACLLTACAWVSHTAPCTNQPASHSQRPSVTRAQNPDFHTGELYDP